MKKIRTSEDIPHYVDPTTIKSKKAVAIARMADFTWWLFNHRNDIVSYGFTVRYKDGLAGLFGGEIIKTPYGRKNPLTIDEVVKTCKEYVDRRRGGKLEEIAVNGGNGEDRPGIPIYYVKI